MSIVDRWLLPDGVEDVLPPQARQLEQIRRRLLDLFRTWGFEYVIPPLVEFLESLLTGTGKDLDLKTLSRSFRREAEGSLLRAAEGSFRRAAEGSLLRAAEGSFLRAAEGSR